MKLNFKAQGYGKPVVILHGLFGALNNWMTVAGKLAGHFKIFAVDQRNHGRSPHTNELNYHLMASDLYEFLNTHNLQKPVLIGHSMGGKTAMQFAVDYPDIAEKLIIVDIAPRKYEARHEKILEGLLALDFNVIRSRSEADKELSVYIPELSLRQFLLQNLYWKEKGKLGWRFNLDALSKNMPLIGKAVEAKEATAIPALFVRGEQSDYMLDADLPLIKRLFIDSKVITIPEAGHWIHAEQPDALVEITIPFIGKE